MEQTDCIPLHSSGDHFIGLYAERKEIEKELRDLVDFVRRYVQNARLVEIATWLKLEKGEDSYHLWYELGSIVVIAKDGELINLVEAVKQANEEGRVSLEDCENCFWDELILDECTEGASVNEVLQPLIFAFADPLAYQPKVAVNIEEPALALQASSKD